MFIDIENRRLKSPKNLRGQSTKALTIEMGMGLTLNFVVLKEIYPK